MNKYVHKKWANNDDWSNDPAWLFENKPKKFEKYVKYYQEKFAGGRKNEKISYKNKQSDSDSDEKPAKKKANPSSGFNKPAAPSRDLGKSSAPVDDLINFDAPANNAPAQNNNPLGDLLGGGGQPANSAPANDGFGDFESNTSTTVNMGG